METRTCLAVYEQYGCARARRTRTAALAHSPTSSRWPPAHSASPLAPRLVHSVAFSPDSALLASGASDGAARLVDCRSGALVQAHAAAGALAGVPAGAPLQRSGVHAVAFHPSGALLLGACADAALRLWDVRAGALAFTCLGHDAHAAGGGAAAGALAAAFSPAGDFFASGGADAQLLVWRTRCDREPGACGWVAQRLHAGGAAV